jgi:pilus assembly protein CpaB
MKAATPLWWSCRSPRRLHGRLRPAGRPERVARPLTAASRRRRRGVLLAGVAAVCGGLAAASVHRTIAEVESRTGLPVPAVVAVRDIAAGSRLRSQVVATRLALRQVPARYVPRDALAEPGQALGLELAVALPAGAYLTAPMLTPPGGQAAIGAPIGRGQRLIEIAVSGGRELTAAGGPARVDVLVTKEGRTGGGRTFIALENVELVAARSAGAADAADGGGTPADTVATLRVGAKAAVFLTAAQNFAREVRLLARPLGDRARVGRSEVAGTGL